MRLIHSDTTESKHVLRKRPMNRPCNGALQKVWMHIWTGVYRVNIDWTWDPDGTRWRKDKSENADGRNNFSYSDGRIENDGTEVRDTLENISI
jgi:hypothetical protein